MHYRGGESIPNLSKNTHFRKQKSMTYMIFCTVLVIFGNTFTASIVFPPYELIRKLFNIIIIFKHGGSLMILSNRNFFQFIIIFLLFVSNVQTIRAESGFSFERMWPKASSLIFPNPLGMTIDSDGLVYVIDSVGRIQVITEDGEFVSRWGGVVSFTPPDVLISHGIVKGTNNELFVANHHENRIDVYSIDGKLLRSWGSRGAQAGQFNGPSGLAISIDGQEVYVVDSYNHRIQVFSREGEVIRSWGSPGVAQSEFNQPTGLSISPNGKIFIADKANNRIQVFSAAGVFLYSWGNYGSNEGQFIAPQAIDIDADGHVYVVDRGNNRIQVFTADGLYLHSWGSNVQTNFGSPGNSDWLGNGEFDEPLGISISPSGKVFVLDARNERLQIFTKDGQFIQKFGAKGSGQNELSFPISSSVSPNGWVYTADMSNNRIQVFTENGKFITNWGEKGANNGQFKHPVDITVDSNGTVFVADSGNNRIQVFTSEGIFINSWKNAGNEGEFLDRPSGVAVSNEGLVYVIDRNFVHLYTPEGGHISSWGSSGSGNEFGFLSDFNPTGISVDIEGNVYVSEGSGRIHIYTAEGVSIREWGVNGRGEEQLKYPADISVSLGGQVFVADRGNERIKVYTPFGQYIKSIGSSGVGASQFKYPNGITINSAGDLFVTDSGAHRIQKFIKTTAAGFAHQNKAIILAGGGPSAGNYINNIWTGTEILANNAVDALKNQGFEKERIKYLTAGNIRKDLDFNGVFDDLEPASLNSLQQAITEWAVDAKDVVIYLIDHGGPGKFGINQFENLSDVQLSTWVDQLDAKISGKVTVIIESCKSGSFLESLASPQRNLISSANSDQPALLSNKGLISFSYYFWSEIHRGATLQKAFKIGLDAIGGQQVAKNQPRQQAQLNSNGDLQFNKSDYDELGSYCLGNCQSNKTASNPPTILSVNDSKVVGGETSIKLSVRVNSLEEILSAWAIVLPPNFQHTNSNDPISELIKIPLACNLTGHCTANYQEFEFIGDYQFTFYVQNVNRQLSLPVSTKITQTKGIPIVTSLPITADYNDETKVLFIEEVVYGNDRYQAELIHSGDFIFGIKAGSIFDSPILQEPNSLGVASLLLTLHKVSAFGKNYKVIMKHSGDFVFQLESVVEVFE